MKQLYYGIRNGYPRVAHFVNVKVAALVQNARPYTLLAPMLGGLAIMLGAGVYVGTFPWIDMLLAAVTLGLLNAGGNYFNSIYDIEIDRENKPYRPLVKGTLTKDSVYSVGTIIYVAAIMLASFVNAYFLLFTFVLFIFSIYYSVPPVRAKKVVWFNNIWQATSRGLLGPVAAWAVVADPMNPIPWAFGFAIMIWTIGAQTTKDFPDIKGDRMYGVRTLPVVYGRQGARNRMIPFVLGAFVFLSGFIYFGLLPQSFQWMLVLAVPSALMLGTVNYELELMENSLAWVMYYATMTLFYVMFAGLLYI